MEPLLIRKHRGFLVIAAVFFSIIILMAADKALKEPLAIQGYIILGGGAITGLVCLWYNVIVRKTILKISDQGIGAGKNDIIFWDVIESYKIREIEDEGAYFDHLVFTFKNGKELSVSLASMEMNGDQIRAAIKQYTDIPDHGRERTK